MGSLKQHGIESGSQNMNVPIDSMLPKFCVHSWIGSQVVPLPIDFCFGAGHKIEPIIPFWIRRVVEEATIGGCCMSRNEDWMINNLDGVPSDTWF
jgi:hypothetical protein